MILYQARLNTLSGSDFSDSDDGDDYEDDSASDYSSLRSEPEREPGDRTDNVNYGVDQEPLSNRDIEIARLCRRGYLYEQFLVNRCLDAWRHVVEEPCNRGRRLLAEYLYPPVQFCM